MSYYLEDFATIEDLAEIWPDYSAEQSDTATALLGYASNFLRQVAKNNSINLDDQINDDTTGIYKKSVKLVTLNIVRRALSAPATVPADATSWSQGASPYSETITLSGGDTANIYIKAKELELLGLGSISGRSQIAILRGVR